MGQYSFDAEDLGPHRAVTEDADASGVRRDHPTDGGAPAGREVHAEIPTGSERVGAERFEGHTSTDGDFTGDSVYRLHTSEALEREDDFTVARHCAADEPRVAALGDDRHPGFGAVTQDGRYLLRVPGADDESGVTTEPAGPIGLVPGAILGINQDVGGADDSRATVKKGIAHWGSVAVEVPGTQSPVPCVSYGDSP